jgi:hypothetical protein
MEPPAGFTLESVLTNDDLSAGGQRGVVIFLPVEPGEMFLLADGFRRVAVNQTCDAGGCEETLAGTYVSPGLTDERSRPNLAYGLWELLTGEDLP